MLKIPEDEALEKLEGLLDSLGSIDATLRTNQAELDMAVKKAQEQFTPAIDRLTAQRDLLMDGVYQIVSQHWDFLMKDQRGKTLTLRGGTIKVRKAADELVVEDEDAAMLSLRRLGKLRKYTRIGKRSLDKNELKKAPEVIDKMKGVSLKKKENLLVNLARTQSELKKVIHPLRRTLR